MVQNSAFHRRSEAKTKDAGIISFHQFDRSFSRFVQSSAFWWFWPSLLRAQMVVSHSELMVDTYILTINTSYPPAYHLCCCFVITNLTLIGSANATKLRVNNHFLPVHVALYTGKNDSFSFVRRVVMN